MFLHSCPSSGPGVGEGLRTWCVGGIIHGRRLSLKEAQRATGAHSRGRSCSPMTSAGDKYGRAFRGRRELPGAGGMEELVGSPEEVLPGYLVDQRQASRPSLKVSGTVCFL